MIRIVTAILGALVVILTNIISFHKYREKMLSFKLTLRTLEKELYLFLLNSGPYSLEPVNKRKRIFVDRVENILEKEALEYVSILASDVKDPTVKE
jgi:hypothetical protein